jgi:hypothetical protein
MSWRSIWFRSSAGTTSDESLRVARSELETWRLPVRRLDSGTYRFAITATSSTCDDDPQLQRTTREFVFRVR